MSSLNANTTRGISRGAHRITAIHMSEANTSVKVRLDTSTTTIAGISTKINPITLRITNVVVLTRTVWSRLVPTSHASTSMANRPQPQASAILRLLVNEEKPQDKQDHLRNTFSGASAMAVPITTT